MCWLRRKAMDRADLLASARVWKHLPTKGSITARQVNLKAKISSESIQGILRFLAKHGYAVKLPREDGDHKQVLNRWARGPVKYELKIPKQKEEPTFDQKCDMKALCKCWPSKQEGKDGIKNKSDKLGHELRARVYRRAW